MTRSVNRTIFLSHKLIYPAVKNSGRAIVSRDLYQNLRVGAKGESGGVSSHRKIEHQPRMPDTSRYVCVCVCVHLFTCASLLSTAFSRVNRRQSTASRVSEVSPVQLRRRSRNPVTILLAQLLLYRGAFLGDLTVPGRIVPFEVSDWSSRATSSRISCPSRATRLLTG